MQRTSIKQINKWIRFRFNSSHLKIKVLIRFNGSTLVRDESLLFQISMVVMMEIICDRWRTSGENCDTTLETGVGDATAFTGTKQSSRFSILGWRFIISSEMHQICGQEKSRYIRGMIYLQIDKNRCQKGKSYLSGGTKLGWKDVTSFGVNFQEITGEEIFQSRPD